MTIKHSGMDITHLSTNFKATLLVCKLLVSMLPVNLDILSVDGPGGAKAEGTLPSTPRPA